MPTRDCGTCGRPYPVGKASGPARKRCPGCAPCSTRDSCGSFAGYQAHGRAGEAACDECMAGMREYQAAKKRRQYEPKPKRWFRCRQCDRRFQHAHPHSVFCSAKCRKRWRHFNRNRDGSPPPSHRQSRWSYLQMRGRILERDGWICQLCGDKIPKGQDYDPRDCDLYPSIDHIVPRSAGGTDDDWNLQAAHWGCNVRKGAGAVGSQMRIPMGDA